MTQKYPKRLIEVDLPIKRISAHAGARSPSATATSRPSIYGGHAGRWRPAARSSVRRCGPTRPIRSARRASATRGEDHLRLCLLLRRTARNWARSCDHETWIKWQAMAKNGALDSHNEAHWNILRFALLDFIADFANWDNSTVQEYLETSRALTQAAHEALGGEPGTRPLVVDPFAGGGSIPLEALRVGADAFASDLNPIPVLLNKVVLEYIPKYGQRLADEVRKWGEWIKQEAEKELAEFYPKDPDGATPIAYLWARTIRCEGPGAVRRFHSSELSMAREERLMTIASSAHAKSDRNVEFKFSSKHGGECDQEMTRGCFIRHLDGTVKRGSATCPCCGYTTPVTRGTRTAEKTTWRC